MLRRELAVVAGYQQTLRTIKKKALFDGDQILRFAAEHQRTVAVLQGSVEARGGAPVVTAGPWEGSPTVIPGHDGAEVMLGSRSFVIALLEVEKHGLAEYEAALPGLDDEARELVQLELIPRQKKHIAGLSALLARAA